MSGHNRVFPGFHLSFALTGQPIEYALLQETVNGWLPFIGALYESQYGKPVHIPAETGVIWPPEAFFTYLNSFLIQPLYLLTESAIDVGSTCFAMFFKILFRKETPLLYLFSETLGALPQWGPPKHGSQLRPCRSIGRNAFS